MLKRKFTFAESCELALVAARIRDHIDAELGELFRKLATGNDSVIPAIHDRMNVLGDFEGADRLCRVLGVRK